MLPVEFSVISEAELQRMNMEAGVGFIAVHPDKGVYLGDEGYKAPVFRSAATLPSQQSIPVFFIPSQAQSLASADPVMLECTLYKVPVTDVKDARTNASAVLKEDKTFDVQNTKGTYPAVVPPETNSWAAGLNKLFFKATHVLDRVFPNMVPIYHEARVWPSSCEDCKKKLTP